MLPYFHIISQGAPIKGSEMYAPDIPPKPKRNKKPDVPIHKSERLDKKPTHERIIKTYSANFSAKRNKPKPEVAEVENDNFESGDHLRYPIEDPEEARINARLSRKHLMKENERLAAENQDLIEKLHTVEDFLTKKNSKLKEKIQSYQTVNDQIVSENDALRNKCNELESQFNSINIEIEKLRHCKSCEELGKSLDYGKMELSAVKKNNHDLIEDINMLKNVVYRLNVQLERYQERLSKYNIKIHPIKDKQLHRPEAIENLETISSENFIKNTLSESHWDHSHTPISWGKVNAHTLGPLLDAYQETVKEKEEIIQDYETELARFTARMKDVIKENELLHKRLTEDTDCSKVLAKQIEVLNVELKSTKEQNDLLIKKCALKQDKIEEILKCYETKVEQMKRDYTILHEQYCKSRTEIAALKEKNRNLIESQDDFRNERQKYIPIAVHKTSVDECKKWYEELKSQYEIEKNKLSENIGSLKQEIKELSDKTTILNSEKSELENKMKISEKQLKKAELKYLDLQHSLNEVQLSRSACRKQLHKAMHFAKELVAEQEALLKALNQRQLENKVVKKLGSDIANRMDSLKNQLKLVQKDAFEELSSVEQRIQEQDSLITSMKEEHNEEVARLKQIIKEKEDNLLLKETVSSIPMPHYLLYKDKHFNHT